MSRSARRAAGGPPPDAARGRPRWQRTARPDLSRTRVAARARSNVHMKGAVMARFESIHLFAGGGGDLIAAEIVNRRLRGTSSANHWTCAVENYAAQTTPSRPPRRRPRHRRPPASRHARRPGDGGVGLECHGCSRREPPGGAAQLLGPFHPQAGDRCSRVALSGARMRFATALGNLTTIIMEQGRRHGARGRRLRGLCRRVGGAGPGRCPGGLREQRDMGRRIPGYATGSTCS